MFTGVDSQRLECNSENFINCGLLVGAGLQRQANHQRLTEANPVSSAATIERLESAVRDINRKLDQVFLSASPHSPSGL